VSHCARLTFFQGSVATRIADQVMGLILPQLKQAVEDAQQVANQPGRNRRTALPRRTRRTAQATGESFEDEIAQVVDESDDEADDESTSDEKDNLPPMAAKKRGKSVVRTKVPRQKAADGLERTEKTAFRVGSYSPTFIIALLILYSHGYVNSWDKPAHITPPRKA
jgi:hypothetical protein